MKGYVFTLDGSSEPNAVLKQGWFSIRQMPKEGRWSPAMLATFADIMTIQPGDLVFFFQNRRVHGIGRVVEFPDAKSVGAWWVNKDACNPDTIVHEWPGRAVIYFQPYPEVFVNGIDMDELLGDAKARPDWALRFFWKASFIQMDDDESRALLGSFIRRFLGERPPKSDGGLIKRHNDVTPFSVIDLVKTRPDLCLTEDGRFRSENILHGILIEEMRRNPRLFMRNGEHESNADRPFHEVAASPPKPADYVDWLDILRIRCWRSSTDGIPHGWDVIECKKDSYDDVGGPEQVVSQLMKYVDFVAREKAARDYGAVRGHYVAHWASKGFVESYHALVADGRLRRSYVLDPHEAKPLRQWEDVRLWVYSWDHKAMRISLTEM